MDGKIFLRILAGLVLIAAITGIAFFAYNAGVAQNVPLPAGETGTVPSPYFGYGMHGWRHPGFFGFGCFGPLMVFFLVFLALRAFGFLFWGPHWGHVRHHGGWHRGGWGEGNVPPMFAEWHDRAHGKPEAEDKKKE
jgi:hypothetical protein